ncbi:repressor LexA [Candidatus Atribacteria bacterium HGW-Atribacteria-1]|nr:MAG: repressor LexA [Candidatus Atribacteria bacterium HGW-Atribacteria-1]
MKSLILTERQGEILRFIILNKEKFGYPPSIPEIQKKFSFKSPNAVQDHLEALERKGYISRRAHKARGIEVLVHAASNENSKNNAIEIPIVGEISAGRPILAQENIEGTIVIDRSIVKNSNGIFALRVKGDSMINAGILNGDYVIASQQPDAEQGDIVVALIEDEATVKRFYKEGNRIRLKPENDTMEPIIIKPNENNVRIIGKIKGVIRKI